MEVWTPYQPEHDELEDEDESYIKPEKNGYVEDSTPNTTTTSSAHHGLFIEDDIRFNEKQSTHETIKKSKKRKEKESLDREPKNQKLLSEFDTQFETTLNFGTGQGVRDVNYNINDLSSHHNSEHSGVQHIIIHPDLNMPIINSQPSEGNHETMVIQPLMTAGLSYSDYPIVVPSYSFRPSVPATYDEQQKPSKQKLDGILKTIPAPMCKTRAKWWWLLQAERLKQQQSNPTTTNTTSSQLPTPFINNNDAYDSGTSSPNGSPRLPPRSRLKDLLDWVQQQQPNGAIRFDKKDEIPRRSQ